MRRTLLIAAALAVVAFAGATLAQRGRLMDWNDLLDRAKPVPSARVAYGPGPLQFADLWLPAGAGPHPVVVMIHGGCWQSDVADASIMGWIADDLRKQGIAVWNVEYRGVDRPGGGYPGSFLDVAAGADALRGAATKYRLELDRVVAVGHSAGGHFAMWLAARPRIARTSPLWTARPLPIAAVVSQGGLPDLAEARVKAAEVCGADTIDKLVGPATAAHRDRFADTSPAALLPIGVPQTLINGARDDIAPPVYATSWVARAKAKGDEARMIVVPGQGHVELIAPETPAWRATVAAIRAALGLTEKRAGHAE